MKYIIILSLALIAYFYFKNLKVTTSFDASNSTAAQASTYVDNATTLGHKVVGGIDTTTGQPVIPQVVNGVKLTYLQRVRLGNI